MSNNTKLEELSWSELEQAVSQFIAHDGPNTDDLPSDDFFSLWSQFEQEHLQRVVEVEGEVLEQQIVLSVVSSSIGDIKIQGQEIFLPDGTRIVFNLRPTQLVLA